MPGSALDFELDSLAFTATCLHILMTLCRFSSSWSPVHWTGRGERICRLKATPAGVTKGDLLVSTWMIVFGCHGRPYHRGTGSHHGEQHCFDMQVIPMLLFFLTFPIDQSFHAPVCPVTIQHKETTEIKHIFDSVSSFCQS